MDLNEQAQAALDEILEQEGNMLLPFAVMSVARQMWLEGFKVGMNTAAAKMNEAFEQFMAVRP